MHIQFLSVIVLGLKFDRCAHSAPWDGLSNVIEKR